MFYQLQTANLDSLGYARHYKLLKELTLTYPPLSEQQRIVGILDEALEGIAIARANAERNLQNARALFESHLQSVFIQGADGWVEKTLEEVCIIGDGNHSSNYPRKDELVEAGVPFIRATNLIAGRISGSDMRFLSPQKHAQLTKGHLKTGDILITNRGEIGKTAIVDSDYDNANLNSQIAWLRCREGMNSRLEGLAEKGFGGEQLAEMQKIIDAEKSDLFDVLAHVAYALPPLTRQERAEKAKVEISTHFNTKQQVFLDFVLSHYVNVGVEELAQEKLTPLLRLKYHNSIADAVADLGRPEEIGMVFAGFQKYLYERQSVA